MGKKQKSSGTLPSKKAVKAFRQVEPVLRPLLELFAVVDDVMSEPDAFEADKIKKSLGRVYREWRDNTRPALDPEFDRQQYRHDMKKRKKKGSTPLGRERLAAGSLPSSTDRKQTSGKSRSKSAENESTSVSPSAKRARSDDRASGGRSTKKSRSESGAGSHSESGKGSGSGLKSKASARSRKKKD